MVLLKDNFPNNSYSNNTSSQDIFPGERRHWYRDFFQGLALEFGKLGISDEQTKNEVDFLLSKLQVKPGSHLVDIACGNGRHALELAKLGYKVTGIDISHECIAEAKKAVTALSSSLASGSSLNELLVFLNHDMCSIEGKAVFDAAYCLGDSFGYFGAEASEAFLETLAGSLKTGARVLVDTSSVAEVLIPHLEPEQSFTLGDLHIIAHNKYHAQTSCLETTYELSHKGQLETRHSLRWIFTAGEVARMLARAGLLVVDYFASTDSEPFDLGARRLLILAQKS